jgi:hypothetical protein
MNVMQKELRNFSTQNLAHPLRFYNCIESCFECANSSWICADACLNEKEYLELKKCVSLCLITAEVCATTARILVQREKYSQQTSIMQLKACMESCQRTAQECLKFSERHEHCFISARCAEACYKVCMNTLQQIEAI